MLRERFKLEKKKQLMGNIVGNIKSSQFLFQVYNHFLAPLKLTGE